MSESNDHDEREASPSPPVRRRGRPRKPDALTPAQRAAAYRARRRLDLERKSVTVTENPVAPTDAYNALVVACDALREQLASTRAECDSLQAALVQAREARDRALERASHASSVGAPTPTAAQVLLKPVPPDDGNGEKRLAVELYFREYRSIERLAAHFGLSRRAVIERLVGWADRDVLRTFDEDEASFDRYVAGTLRAR